MVGEALMEDQVKETKSIKWLLISIAFVVLILAAGTFAWLLYYFIITFIITYTVF